MDGITYQIMIVFYPIFQNIFHIYQNNVNSLILKYQ